MEATPPLVGIQRVSEALVASGNNKSAERINRNKRPWPRRLRLWINAPLPSLDLFKEAEHDVAFGDVGFDVNPGGILAGFKDDKELVLV